jgi:REP element-mobilizing transposase RayT
VTIRGNRGVPIFVIDRDRIGFLRLLGTVAREHEWQCRAYCLMTNHFHLLVETPSGDLSSGMKKLNNTYALRFNKDHGFRGHLFEERFNHEPVVTDWHLVNVIRYLALNPVEAGLVERPEDWIWGSFAAVVGRARAPDFLDVDWTLRLFADEPASARERLLRLATPEPDLVAV